MSLPAVTFYLFLLLSYHPRFQSLPLFVLYLGRSWTRLGHLWQRSGLPIWQTKMWSCLSLICDRLSLLCRLLRLRRLLVARLDLAVMAGFSSWFLRLQM